MPRPAIFSQGESQSNGQLPSSSSIRLGQAPELRPWHEFERIGREEGSTCTVEFYGSSFIADHTGAIVAEAGRTDRAVILTTFDLDAIDQERVNWGVFRDRRPELYKPILTLDGRSPGIGT